MSVVPDKVTPEIGWRGWKIEKGILTSPSQGTRWKPGEPLHATCTRRMHSGFYPPQPSWRWEPRAKRAALDGGEQLQYGYWNGTSMIFVPPPQVALPPSMHWVCCVTYPGQPSASGVPHDNCACGIYAVRDPLACAESYGKQGCGDDLIVGTVKLWGKVIPGERGWRAEYAYPASFFIVRPKLGRRRFGSSPAAPASFPALEAFDVPIHYLNELGELWTSPLVKEAS